ncbi:MAG: hypothetical protein WA814_07160 [Candidatus Baltobacteraceae bacterium]
MPVAPREASEYALQRVMERQVLTLLHRVNNPGALAAAPLMTLVCAEMGTSNPVAALERIVLSALGGDDEDATRLRNAIFDVDFRRVSTNAELARRNGISRRHFQRWRAEAVAAIALHARRILQNSSAEGPAESRPAPAPRRDSKWRFTSESAALARAADRENLPEMRAIAGNLLRLADTREARAFAWAALADADAGMGRGDDVIEHLGRLPIAAGSIVRAKHALLAENAGDAEAFARDALAVLRDGDPARYRCHALVSQIRLVRGAPWRPPVEAKDLPICSWEHNAMGVEAARHRAAERAWGDAERLGLAAYKRAETLGYTGLIARAAAVMHAVEGARERRSPSNWWRARAIAALLPTQSRLLATRLFLDRSLDAEVAPDDLLADALYERLCLIVPQMLGEGGEQRAALRRFVAATIDASSIEAGAIEAAIEPVRRSASAFVYYAPKLVEPICEMLALARTALAGAPWNVASQRVRERLVVALSKIKSVGPRTFEIAIPAASKSQRGAPNHLRVYDEGAAGRGSVEDLAGLRVRVVPLQSGSRTTLPRQRGRAVTGTARPAARAVNTC